MSHWGLLVLLFTTTVWADSAIGGGGGLFRTKHRLPTRAVAVYVDNFPVFVNQSRALYASWTVVRHSRSSIDLLFFLHPDVRLGDDLDCSPRTVVHNALSECFLISVNDSSATQLFGERQASNHHSYPFVKSLDFLVYPEARFLLGYDYVMKTDCDTFITPAFARWLPAGPLYVGRGGYNFMMETQHRLVAWAEENGYKHRGVHNLGATWYGWPTLIIEAARLAAQITAELHATAFNDANGKIGWPRWHKGVSSMYAQEIAINQVVPDAQPTPLLDFPSNNEGSVNNVYHIHCWHTDEFFSKHAHQANFYKDLDARFWNSADVRVYALLMNQMADGKLPIHTLISTFPEPIGNVTPVWADLFRKPVTNAPPVY